MNLPITYNTLVRGDCLAILPELPRESVDFILTEPPYLVSYTSRDNRSVLNDDNDAWLMPAFSEMYRVLMWNRFCVSFYGWPHTDSFFTAFRAAGFRVVGHLVFRKRYNSSVNLLRHQHEVAYLLAKGYPRRPVNPISDVIDWTYSGNKLHPTEKPLSALLPLVETFSTQGGLVLDPFSGSGSTLHAAKVLGRRYLGIELDPKYHQIATDRLNGVPSPE